ncbi:hypothetical protein L539_1260 [Bordetella hinzii 5132]|nr:hypothetical protein L539_1260 [Bordetella hinzii 5132]
MAFDGFLAHVELFGDGFVAQAVADQAQHVELARGEGAQQGGGIRRRAGRRGHVGPGLPERGQRAGQGAGAGGFVQVILGARLQGAPAVFRVFRGRQHQDAQLGPALAQPPQQFGARHVGQVVVHDDEIDAAQVVEQGQRLRAGGSRQQLQRGRGVLQGEGQAFAEHGVIIHQQDGGHGETPAPVTRARRYLSKRRAASPQGATSAPVRGSRAATGP